MGDRMPQTRPRPGQDTRTATGSAEERARSPRRSDPTRRDRLIDTCLDVIADAGLEGTSHRRIAATAAVPLGSMTYHFQGMDDLLRVAFGRFVHELVRRLEVHFAGGQTLSQVRSAVVAVAIGELVFTAREVTIMMELTGLSSREPAYRNITEQWTNRRQVVLAQYFDAVTVEQLATLIDGSILQRALRGAVDDIMAHATIDAVRRITEDCPFRERKPS